jgi:hypothetical protein
VGHNIFGIMGLCDLHACRRAFVDVTLIDTIPHRGGCTVIASRWSISPDLF